MNRIWFLFVVSAFVDSLGIRQRKSREEYRATPYITVTNLTSAVHSWPGEDVAVFFYSPYGEAGTFSRQVLPLWDEVSRWHRQKRTKKLAIVKFNCEASLNHQQSCYDFGVRQYPTIRYYGYDRLSFRRGVLRRAADYRGLAMAEALRDWTVTLRAASGWQLFVDRIRIFLGFKTAPEIIELHELRQLKRNLELQESLSADLARLRKDSTSSASSLWDDLFAGLPSSSSTPSTAESQSTEQQKSSFA